MDEYGKNILKKRYLPNLLLALIILAITGAYFGIKALFTL